MELSGMMTSLFRLPPFFDFVDIFNCVITNAILAFFMCLTMVYQNIGHSMTCIVTAKPGTWQGFYNEYCFTQGRFQMVDDANSPTAFLPTGFAVFFVRNFQWMPYLFILQLVLFAIPKFAWTVFALPLKNVNQIVSAISQARCLESLRGEERTKEVEVICDFLLQSLGTPENRRSNHQGRLTMLLYVTQKWLQVLNLIVQFGIGMFVVDSTSIFWGFELMSQVLIRPSEESLRKFPKRAICYIPDDYGYVKGSLNITAPNQMIQANCIIRINVVYEQLYVFLYFWFSFLFFITFLMAIHYTLFLLMPRYRMFCASKFLPTPKSMAMGSAMGQANPVHISSPSNHLLEYFVNSVLMTDGCMALWFIRETTGSQVSVELAHRIWNSSVSRAKSTKPILPIRGSLDYLGSPNSSSLMLSKPPLYPGEKLSASNLLSRSTSNFRPMNVKAQTSEREKFSKTPTSTSKSSFQQATASASSGIGERSSKEQSPFKKSS